ncbi:hypothetical protein EXW39_16655 [Bacillus mycoides]|uniref:DUF6339 family protein n=1 Tax=Bacillus TaxID=1386 RepID=UPI001C013FC6|nr:DUF6339 family protein [Bacillus mycoides]QWH61697.1 hypothetical protein EXW39_16655 [Bacillus mycoides]
MEVNVRLLKSGYRKSEKLYNDFKANTIVTNEEYFTDKVISLPSDVPFPIYMAKGSDAVRKEEFLEAFRILADHYIMSNRDLHLDEVVWHSYFITYHRDYLIEKYPSILEDQKEFEKIVTKSFDWENYIYKCVLATEYVEDYAHSSEEKQYYYRLIFENLDLYNYIIKYEIFRNKDFLLKVLKIVDELKISHIMKAKIKDRPDLGSDERYGRRVIFELNKSYPVVMAPMLEKEALKKEIIRALSHYYDVSTLLLSKATV